MKNKIKILIFDEEPSNIVLIKNFLKDQLFIYKIYSFSNINNLIENFSQINPDILFIDYTPQTKNNPNFINFLSSIKNNQDITKIFTIYSTDPKTIEEIFDIGANDYILKPYNRMEVIKKIDNHKNQILSRQLKLEEERLIAAKNTSGAILHELNQPINVIYMLTDLYIEKYKNNEIISKIRKNLNKINYLMQSFLNISKYKTKNYLENTSILDIDNSNESIPTEVIAKNKNFIFLIIDPENSVTKILEPLLNYKNIPFIHFQNTLDINKTFLHIKNIFLPVIYQYNKEEILNFIKYNHNFKYIIFANNLTNEELKLLKNYKVVDSIDVLYDVIFYEKF